MLAWPIFGIIILYFRPLGKNVVDVKANKKLYRSQLYKHILSKWFLGYFLFQCYFTIFAALSGTKLGDFDPSGHLTCGLLAGDLWISMLHFAKDTENFFNESDPFLSRFTYSTFIIIIYHLYGLFFTVCVYHDSLETLVGLFFGLILHLVVFHSTQFSNALYFIVTKSMRETEKSMQRAWIIERGDSYQSQTSSNHLD